MSWAILLTKGVCVGGVSLQVVVYTRRGGKEVVWDVQWTGSEGTAEFFLVPG